MFNRFAAVCACGIAAAVVAAGCRVKCRTLPDAQAAVRARALPPASGDRPHAQLRLPHHRVNALLADVVADDPPAVTMPNPLRLIPLGELRVVARRVELGAAGPDRIGFTVVLALEHDRRVLTTMELDIEGRPELVRGDSGAAIEIAFDGDSVRAVRPRLGADAIAKLAVVLPQHLPESLRDRIPGPLLATAAGQLISYVAEESFPLVRRTLLARLGEVTRSRVSLPELPIERIRARTVELPQPGLAIDIFTSLPVTGGLAAEADDWAPVSATAELRFAGPTVAEVANWSITAGHLPRQYNRELEPRDGGDYVPVYAWGQSGRPLRIHVFQIEGRCNWIEVGARPRAELDGDKLVVSVDDGNIERVIEGSPLVRFGVWVKRLSSGAIARSQSVAAGTTVTVGKRTVRARVVDVSISGDELRFAISLESL